MVYVFKRHKKTGKKDVITENVTIDEAREMCSKENSLSNTYFFEFTEDVEYTKN